MSEIEKNQTFFVLRSVQSRGGGHMCENTYSTQEKLLAGWRIVLSRFGATET